MKKKKKLFPEIKLISFEENNVSTPLCTCDSVDFLKPKPICLCEYDSNKGYESCITDTYCSLVKRKCGCDFHIEYKPLPPPCYCNDKCSRHDENCYSDFKIPLTEGLPKGCECFTTHDENRVIANITSVSINGVKSYKKTIDRRTGKQIK